VPCPRAGFAPWETGCCPHTAIRDDISATSRPSDLKPPFRPPAAARRKRGDNFTATFSRGLVRRQIYIIDVAADKVPRKDGPGIARVDLLVINQTDLADRVGGDLSVMDPDARWPFPGQPMTPEVLESRLRQHRIPASAVGPQ
jgi:urease accessory protein